MTTEAAHTVPHERSSRIRTCSATLSTGAPCGQAARRGRALCRLHDPEAQKTKAAKAVDELEVQPLKDLVAINLEDSVQLRTFRRGLLAHVAKRTIDVQTARGMHELAQAIHDAAHEGKPSDTLTSLTTVLRKAMKFQDLPGGTPGETGEQDDLKGPAARTESAPK